MTVVFRYCVPCPLARLSKIFQTSCNFLSHAKESYSIISNSYLHLEELFITNWNGVRIPCMILPLHIRLTHNARINPAFH